MTTDTTDALNAIGTEILLSNPDGPRAFFLYVEGAEGVIDMSLYQEYVDHVDYVDVSRRLDDLLFQFWDDAETEQKWGTFVLELDDHLFTSRFEYEPRLEDEDDEHDYRQDALNARFGEKKIVYPPFDYEAEVRRAAAMGGGAFEL